MKRDNKIASLADKIANSICHHYGNITDPITLTLNDRDYSLLIDLVDGIEFDPSFIELIIDFVNNGCGFNPEGVYHHLTLATDSQINRLPVRIKGPSEYFVYEWGDQYHMGKLYIILSLGRNPLNFYSTLVKKHQHKR